MLSGVLGGLGSTGFGGFWIRALGSSVGLGGLAFRDVGT